MDLDLPAGITKREFAVLSHPELVVDIKQGIAEAKAGEFYDFPDEGE